MQNIICLVFMCLFFSCTYNGLNAQDVPTIGSEDVVTAETSDAVMTRLPDAGHDTPLADLALSVDAGSGGLQRYLTEELFNAWFPHHGDAPSGCRGAIYTFANFVAAAARFPAFITEGTDEQRRRELAAFLANISHETTGGWSTAPGGPQAWGLCFVEEFGCERGGCASYCVETPEFPCVAGATYWGRGCLQLSYNYNYGLADRYFHRNLLQHPEQVSNDGVLAFATGIWFWMTPQSPKPSCHDVMIGRWTPNATTDRAAGRMPGFGQTVNIINGGVECGAQLQTPPQPNPRNLQDRLRYYTHFTSLLRVTEGENVDCGIMQRY